ncbi:MAG: glycosyl hydrolase, partial [Verrucomicrobiota bacterium]
TLLSRAAVIIRGNPDNKVILGGLALYDGTDVRYGPDTFFDTILSLGAGANFDIVNYHSYGNGDCSAHMRRFGGMMEVLEEYGIESRPIWITETGYTSMGDDAKEFAKAEEVEKTFLLFRQLGVERVFWYLFRNVSTADPAEGNFGVLTTGRTPLPAYYSYQALGAASTDFINQAAYPSLYKDAHTLYHIRASAGDGRHVVDLLDGGKRIPANTVMYFSVNDTWLRDSNEDVDRVAVIEVDYVDVGMSDWYLQYDGQDGAYTSIRALRTNTGGVRTKTFVLADARFTNRQNNQADFRISAGTQELIVKAVRIKKSPGSGAVVLQTQNRRHLVDHVLDTNVNREAYNPVATMGELECRSITGDKKMFYFRVADGFVGAGDMSVTLRVTFWDHGTQDIWLQYNALDNDYKLLKIRKTDTGAWRTVDIYLPDADFTNQQNYHADFRISTGGRSGDTEYLRRVEVIKNSNVGTAVLRSENLWDKVEPVFTSNAGGEAYNEAATMGGVPCRSIVGARKMFYFRVNDDFVGAGDSSVTVAVTFWDQGSGELWLQYNAINNVDHKKAVITKTDTGGWKTVSVRLLDADFTNRQSYGADFRISTGGRDATEYVSRVEVIKDPDSGSVVLGTVDRDDRVGHVIGGSTSACYNPVAIINGVECRSIHGTGKMFYFQVDDCFIGSVTSSVSLAVTFLDSGTGRLFVDYNSVDELYKRVWITKTGTNLWRTIEMPLTDAKFRNAQNYQADFRIGTDQSSSPEYVRRVEVTKN